MYSREDSGDKYVNFILFKLKTLLIVQCIGSRKLAMWVESIKSKIQGL